MENNNNNQDEDNTPIPQFKCPDWASTPISNAFLEVYKNGEVINQIDISKEKYTVFGRNSDVSNVVLDHPSVSRRHAALVYHGVNDRFYLIDLNSAEGTMVNNEKIKPTTPTTVKEGFTFSFASSSKQFVLKNTAPVRAPTLQEVRCRHLLVKHRGSRNPSSWRETNITRTKEEAIAQLLEYKKMIDSGKNKFEDLAKKYSDCSSAKRGGDLGHFKRGQMQKPFENCSFSLQVGQISDIVDTDSGVHIIQRLE
ncbi:hypothetical protein DICPUDRAFT_157953 [Dictyostelium purpureum]|uniref:Peptidyl-prolyl cis-trans isomerase n=1 Tax=Dictyostelium purpureum TaxID=5786 RepID=F1A0F9_DICPU|nr:uncharacterized protein DICPUDRAFT_157953 [Dictyostelium purpureum]EGC30332.1 hypothetical protein DICPUDRAFT_157953 [Dictyostelium purpureum]|eukprot:XP_003293155.1 hypothetical protein DICPUDRAFT_157953 [Dictyostelium purpureum]